MHTSEATRKTSSDPADALQRIDEVLRLARSAIWEIDREGVFTYVSPSFETLLGYRPEELVGIRKIHDFYPPDLSPSAQKEAAPDWIREGREFTNSEVPLLAKSGEVVWVASDGKPVFDEGGRIAGFRGADTDITPRKKLEDRLAASESQLMDLITAAPVPMAYTTIAGRDEMNVNKAFQELFGYAPQEISTMEDWFLRAFPDEIYREEVRRRSVELMGAFLSGRGVSERRDYRITRKDGRVLEVQVDAVVVGGSFVGTFVDVTERRRSVEQARAAQSEMRGILDNLPFPVAMSAAGPDFDWTDPRAEVLYLNGSFTALFGYGRSEIPTVADWARLSFRDETRRLAVMAGLDEQVRLALAGESNVGPVETRISAKDGREVDAVIKAVVFGGSLVIAFQDVTERNRARRLLEESEMRLLGVIENTPVPVAYTSDDARRMRMNKAFTDVYGWGEEDLPTVDAWFEKAYPDPEYRREVMAMWNADVERALQTEGKIAARFYRVTAKDGSVREVEITAAIFEGEMFGTFLDLTERNRAERLLRESEKTLRGLFENAPLGIVRMDMTSHRLWVNKAFTATLGYTAGDIPTFEDWLRCAYPDADHREQVRADWAKALREAMEGDGRIADGEVRVTAKDGREHEMQFSGVVIGNELFGMWADLTDRNRSERLLREQREQIAHAGRVSALGQLAASLAHELDQPLGAILNNAEAARILLGKKKPPVEELGEIVGDIIEDDRRAGAVLDRIRAMVQKQSFRPGPVDVPQLFRETMRLVQPMLEKKQIKLETSCEPALCALEGDYVLLQQALLNLVLNSVDAIGRRKDGVVSMRAGEAANSNLELTVSDNAGGIPRDEMASLLQPFHTTKDGGLGMGLPIVTSIIEQHGGMLRFDNQPGRGLAVSLVLPRWKGAAPA